MKSTIRISMLGLAILALSLSAFAANKDIVTSKDGSRTIATKSGGHVAAPVIAPAGSTFIYNNISSYPLGRYWCCEGYTISGPDSVVGETFADAMPFTPSANYTVTTVVVAVGYVTGTNTVTVSLNADSGGLPGAALATFNQSNLGTFGDCCTYSVKGGLSVPVTGGTQYWIVVEPGADDTWAAWNDNDTNETLQPFAFYNGVWNNTEGDLGAFAVLGH